LITAEVAQAVGSAETLALACETIWRHTFQVTAVRNSHVTAEIILKVSDWLE